MRSAVLIPLLFLTSAAIATPREPMDPVELFGKTCLAPLEMLRESDDRGYDCLEVTLELDIDFDTRTIRGHVGHRVKATTDLDTLRLDLTDSLTVGEVRRNGEPIPFVHANRKISIPLVPPLGRGDQETVEIRYGGHPPREGWLGFVFETRDGVPAAYTLSEPDGSASWWPCKDVPDDKMLATIILEIPDSLYAGSNGILISDETVQGRRRMTWQERWPIAPYLVCIACTNYTVFQDLYRGIDGATLPLLYLSYPEDFEEARSTWARTPEMLRAFEDRFGPYPFPGEKYGMAEVSFGGAMEHQTLTSFGEYAIDGTDQNDWLVAHELAHHWWGNLVTLSDWDHMWLNEGFSRYSEALWFEESEGPNAYREWMLRMWRPSFPGVVVPPDEIFNATVYFKGAWILYMLRGVLGDADFFAGLSLYSERHAYANAETQDLRKAFEEIAGRDLDWFFDQWVYRPGRPRYLVTWDVAEGEQELFLELTIEQAQSEPPFRMPIVFEVVDPLGAYRFSVEDSLRIQTFRLPIRHSPSAVHIDPDNLILRHEIHPSGITDDPPVRLSLGEPWPSPGRPPFWIPVDDAIRGDRLDLFDLRGRRITRIEIPGHGPAVWSGRDDRGRPVGSGLYLVRRSGNGPKGTTRRIWIVR